MSAGELCNRQIETVDKNKTVLEAAQLMRQRHVGDVVIVEPRDGNAVPVGIVTDRDIVIEVIAKGLKPEEVTIGSIMSQNLATVREHDGIFETILMMRARGVRRVPVVNEEGALVGILSIDDLMELLAEEMTELSKVTPRERAVEAFARP